MRVVVATLAVVVGLVVLAGSVLIFSGAYYVGADKPHWSSTAWLLTQARDRSIRAHASGVAVPVATVVYAPVTARTIPESCQPLPKTRSTVLAKRGVS